MQQMICLLVVGAAVVSLVPLAGAQSATKAEAAGAPNAEAMG